jgi:hypothetical protein
MSNPLPIDDLEIRTNLIQLLKLQYANDYETCVFNEFGIRHGLVRADIAVINGVMHGYEFKSELDSLYRLPVQASVYSSVFDLMTLVVAKQHVKKALAIIPKWWGVEVVGRDSSGNLNFNPKRKPRFNRSVDPLSVSKLLWREEALGILEKLNLDRGFRSKPRAAIYNKMIEVFNLRDLCAEVRKCLRSRVSWKFDELQTLCGD